MLRNLSLLSTIGLAICLNASANAACIDLKQKDALSFEGTLNYRIFPGPPNYEDVRKAIRLNLPTSSSWATQFVPPGMSLSIRTLSSTEFKYFLSLAKPVRRSGETFGALLGNASSLQGPEHSDAIRGTTMLR